MNQTFPAQLTFIFFVARRGYFYLAFVASHSCTAYLYAT